MEGIAALHPDGDDQFIETEAGLSCGVLREGCQDPIAANDAVGIRSTPAVPKPDVGLVEPDVVPALLQAGRYATNQFLAILPAWRARRCKISVLWSVAIPE